MEKYCAMLDVMSPEDNDRVIHCTGFTSNVFPVVQESVLIENSQTVIPSSNILSRTNNKPIITIEESSYANIFFAY